MQQRKIRVLGIAPYSTLKQVMLQASKAFPQMELTVAIGAITEGVKILKQYPEDAFDCIISRGGTKMEVEKYAKVPVIEIPISYFDLLNIFKLVENYHGQFWRMKTLPIPQKFCVTFFNSPTVSSPSINGTTLRKK